MSERLPGMARPSGPGERSEQEAPPCSQQTNNADAQGEASCALRAPGPSSRATRGMSDLLPHILFWCIVGSFAFGFFLEVLSVPWAGWAYLLMFACCFLVAVCAACFALRYNLADMLVIALVCGVAAAFTSRNCHDPSTAALFAMVSICFTFIGAVWGLSWVSRLQCARTSVRLLLIVFGAYAVNSGFVAIYVAEHTDWVQTSTGDIWLTYSIMALSIAPAMILEAVCRRGPRNDR